MEFSNLKMKEVLKSQTSKRVSQGAAQELSAALENRGIEIAEKAIEYAKEDGRVTVRDKDIKAALRN